jgi:hypothetical protein
MVHRPISNKANLYYRRGYTELYNENNELQVNLSSLIYLLL